MNGTIVDAAFDVAGLAAGNAAHVVTDMVIPHGAPVDTGTHHTGRTAGDTADIGNIGSTLGGEQVLYREIFQVDFIFIDGGIDGRLVGALGDDTVVLTGHTAHKVVAVHTAVHRAAGDDAGDRVGACNTADLPGAADRTAEGAVADGPGVFSRQTAYHGPASARLHRAFHMQVLHPGILLQIPEQSLHTALLRQVQPADGMSLPFQRTAKGGDSGKVAAGQVNILRHHHGAAHTPTVQTTVPGQSLQLFRRGNLDGFRCGFFRPDGGCQQPGQQAQAQHRREKAVILIFHNSSPSV